MSKETPLLNIYPQYTYHSEARILGNRSGLIALRGLLDAALAGDPNDESSVFASDGEGYNIEIRCIDEAWAAALPAFYSSDEGDWSETQRAAFMAALDGRAKGAAP